MLAVKANYENGKVSFSEPFPTDIKRAKLLILIQSEDDGKNIDDFHLLGYNNFSDSDNDSKVDWEKHFGLEQ
jgi:hypothetical protein